MYSHDDYYLLGFGYQDATIKDNKVNIVKYGEDRDIMTQIAASLYGGGYVRPEYHGKFALTSGVTLVTGDNKIRHLYESYDVFGKSGAYRRSPIPEEYAWSFLCGLFDGYGDFHFHPRSPRIKLESLAHLDSVIELAEKKWEVKRASDTRIIASGDRALDICGRMYANVKFRNPNKFDNYIDALNWVPPRGWAKTEHFAYQKLDPKAVAPQKTRVTDSGYDIHAITMEHVKGDVYMADTKLAVRPAPGMYFDLIGRSSLPPKGWSLLQGVGVIDRSYRGSLILHLHKLWSDAPMPQMPFKCGQLVPRPIVHAEWEEVEEMDDTDRGVRGVGSTDV